MPNLEPTATELAAREAALRSSILGTSAMPFGGQPVRSGTRYPENPIPTPAPQTYEPVVHAGPTILSLDFTSGQIVTTEGVFALNETELQVFAAAAVLAFKRNCEDVMTKLMSGYGLTPEMLFGGMAPVPVETVRQPAAPEAVVSPSPGELAEVVRDEVDPPHPNPRPIRQPRRKR